MVQQATHSVWHELHSAWCDRPHTVYGMSCIAHGVAGHQLTGHPATTEATSAACPHCNMPPRSQRRDGHAT
eukprot:366539-Chlamydomonas_euryale.AAC.16